MSNGLWNSVLETFHFLDHTIQHVKLAKIECLYSVDVILRIKSIMILFISNYVQSYINILALFQWYQPPNQKSIGPPKNSMSKIGGP